MMRRITITAILFSSFTLSAQQQIGNSNMEAWDNVGAATEEPTNWNSFKTAEGSLASFGSQQLQRSTSIRTGATGSYCARIWSKSTLGVVANGNMTLGIISMGSSTPSSSSNYNYSKTADANFSEAMTSSPDSLVFWVKYTAANLSDSARVHAILHDAYDLRDPLDANSVSHVVARAERNYIRTGGNWIRVSVPFVYYGPATTPAFLLVTFTTNKTPGGGTANDEVLVDDIQLIYNPTGTNQQMVANNDTQATNQDTPVTISVLTNDTDPENNINIASVTITTNPTHGTAVANNDGTVTYTPTTGYFGSDSFVYNVCDGGSPATCAQATVSITVNQVSGIEEESISYFTVYYSSKDGIQVNGQNEKLIIVNSNGTIVKSGTVSELNGTRLNSGLYFVKSEIKTVKVLVP